MMDSLPVVLAVLAAFVAVLQWRRASSLRSEADRLRQRIEELERQTQAAPLPFEHQWQERACGGDPMVTD